MYLREEHVHLADVCCGNAGRGGWSALRRLAEGGGDLARLAQDVRFADQARTTRVLRREAGLPPGRLRALLTAADAAASGSPTGHVRDS